MFHIPSSVSKRTLKGLLSIHSLRQYLCHQQTVPLHTTIVPQIRRTDYLSFRWKPFSVGFDSTDGAYASLNTMVARAPDIVLVVQHSGRSKFNHGVAGGRLTGRTHLARTLIQTEIPRIAGIAVAQAEGLEVPLLRVVGVVAVTLMSNLKVHSRLVYVERVMLRFWPNEQCSRRSKLESLMNSSTCQHELAALKTIFCNSVCIDVSVYCMFLTIASKRLLLITLSDWKTNSPWRTLASVVTQIADRLITHYKLQQ